MTWPCVPGPGEKVGVWSVPLAPPLRGLEEQEEEHQVHQVEEKEEEEEEQQEEHQVEEQEWSVVDTQKQL